MTRLVRLVLLLAACGSSPPTLHNTKPPQPPARDVQPSQSLDDAMRASGLARIELPVLHRETAYGPGDPPAQTGRVLRVFETAGWNAQPTLFARRASDGLIVIVTPEPHTIVDGHVNAGCERFAGGRAWFEQVDYQLPEGERYGGHAKVTYDHHVTVEDHTTTQPDGSPCPPPMID